MISLKISKRHGPTFFSFEELLCDNPVDAFKYHLQKTDPLTDARPLVSENQDEQNSQPKRSLNKNIDVDDVFGFDNWEEAADIEQEEEKPESPAKKSEEGEEVQLPQKANDEEDEDLMDLFEYNIEESFEKPQGKVHSTESPESKIKKLESETTTTTTSGSKSTEKGEKEFEESLSPGKRVKVIQTKKEIKEIQVKNGQELREETGSNSMSIFERLEARAKEQKEAKQQEIPVQVVPAKAAVDEREAMITKTVQKWLGLGGKDSVKKKEIKPKETTKPAAIKELVQETVENYTEKEGHENPQVGDEEEECFFKKVAVEDLYVPNPDAVFIWSEDSNQKKIKKDEEVEEALVKEEQEEELVRQNEVKEEVFAEIMDIIYDKEDAPAPKEEQQEVSFQGPTEQLVEQKEEENTDSNLFNILGPEENFDHLNEADLMARMKELEEDDMTDKWALMDQFQKFQNLSDLEGGSIQDKLREIKELLIMLGVPWVDSPSEAEAQCSYLEMNGLVDGVITDDSDVFLFGARNVYRNMFDKGDYAHSFQMRNIEKDMGIDRSKLILMALFLGSDYTLGVRGVGIVNAIEIVRAFETPEALERFKAWAEMPDVFMEDASVHYKDVSTKELEYKLYHRNFKKHWELPENFPDYRVVEAYEKPAVDLSLEKFEWGAPDVENIESMCSKRFNWDEDKVKNTLEPLKKAIKDRKGQKRITDFFREDKLAEINSKRINKAVSSLQNQEDGNAVAEHTEMIEKRINKQNAASLKRMPTEDESALEGFAFQKKKTKKTPRNIIL